MNLLINWRAHTSKIADKISRTLGVMNRLKRYLSISVMKLMYYSLILSHLQFGITCWGFECNRLFKLQKRALRIMTKSKHNAHTEPLFKYLKLLKLDGIFDIQCMTFFCKFTNNTLPKYFHSSFRYNRDIYEIETRNHNQLHLFATRTHRILTHSIQAFFSHLKLHIIDCYWLFRLLWSTVLGL